MVQPHASAPPSPGGAPSAPPQPAGTFYGLASGSAAGPRAAPQVSREEMKQPVELTLSCNNLINTDTFSKSDPFIVAYEIVGGAEVEIDRTEVVMDNLNPQFTKPIRIDFRFEETQNLLFRVYDLDDKSKGLESQDFLGEARTSLAEIVTQNEITISLKMPNSPSRNCGTLTLHSEESNGSEDEVMFTIGCKNIPKKKFFGKTDAVLEVCRVMNNEGAARVAAAAMNRTVVQPIHRTETVKNVITCNWKAFGVRLHRLCNGDLHRPLLFRIMHYRSSGNHELVGQVEASLDSILKGNVTLELKSRSGRSAGSILFHTARVVTRYSFLDYVRSGFEISLVTAIDFTASNGDPNQPTSLHYRNPQQPNEYLKAIMAVGDIVAHYDKDQRFPVYGFGAKIPPHGQLSHCFPCTFDENRPEVVGVQGILDCYASALNQVTLYGPTYFAPIIQRVSSWARQSKQQYWVLLLLTDGVIVDMQPTIDAIVEASDLPLSIIIVGVGNEDFSKMDILDADDEPLKSSRGQLMKRDIVQFVPFRQFANQPYSKLAQETLREVPDQLVSWAKDNRVPPLGRQWQA